MNAQRAPWAIRNPGPSSGVGCPGSRLMMRVMALSVGLLLVLVALELVRSSPSGAASTGGACSRVRAIFDLRTGQLVGHASAPAELIG